MCSKISNEIPLGSKNKFSIYISSPISSPLSENFIEINTFQQKKVDVLMSLCLYVTMCRLNSLEHQTEKSLMLTH